MGNLFIQTSYPTAPPIGYEGQLHGQGPFDIVTGKNAEASVAIPFGRAVKAKPAPTTEYDVVLPTAGTDAIVGIVAKSDVQERAWTGSDGTVYGSYGSTGLRPGAFLDVLREGKILAVAQGGCAKFDRLYVRAVAGTYTVIGGLESAADSTNTIDCTKQGQWLSAAGVGGLAILDVDFTNKP